MSGDFKLGQGIVARLPIPRNGSKARHSLGLSSTQLYKSIPIVKNKEVAEGRRERERERERALQEPYKRRSTTGALQRRQL